jgi:hypothetical protein
MPSPSGLIKKLDNTLKRFMPMERKVYKRVVTRTGGDDLIGRPGSVTSVDTLLDPQPYYEAMQRGGGSQDVARLDMAIANTKATSLSDYEFLISPTAMTRAELNNRNVFLVLKDASGNAEVLEILPDKNYAFDNTVVAFQVQARTIKRP